MNKLTFAFAVFFGLSFSLFGQVPQPAGTPPELPEIDRDVLKISTTLVQLDFVVTDDKGNQITDIVPEELELFVNGKKQEITNFSYIAAKTSNTANETSSKPAAPDKNSAFSKIPPPPQKTNLEQVRRTYALVVDDLGLSFVSIRYVQLALRKFINEQMQDGDLAAIIRTGSGIGALQSFTTNKQQLLAAVDKIKWNSYGRSGIGTFAAIEQDIKEEIASTSKTGRTVQGADSDKEFAGEVDTFRNENFSVGTLGALNYIIGGMRELPGRKALMLFSDGFEVPLTGPQNRVFEQMKVLADAANRSSVVIYTLDPRGLQVPGMAFAEDRIPSVVGLDFSPGTGRFDADARDQRQSAFRGSQQSLRNLAYETGGTAFVNQNDLNIGMERAINDQSGYYLLGYQPDSETFDPKANKFNKIEIKLKRGDGNIRYRSGFYSYTDKKLESVKKTPGQQIYGALVSPFGSSDISLSLNTLFAEDENGKSFIRSLVAIDAKDLNFSKEPDGSYKANFDIIAMTFGDNGAAVDETSKNYSITLGEKAYQNALEKGFIYDLVVPVKKPGAYQFRVALRDSRTERVGSASQFIDVPNLRKNRLELSSIVLEGYSPEEWAAHSKNSGNSVNTTTYNVDSALRRFKNGSILRFDYIVFNAKGNPPDLRVRARLFRDGMVVVEGTETGIDVSALNDPSRIEAAGAITLGRNLEPGNYVLQIAVTDQNASRKSNTASRWIDFDILP